MSPAVTQMLWSSQQAVMTAGTNVWSTSRALNSRHLHRTFIMPKARSDYVAGFVMVVVKAALYPPLQWLPIRGDDGHGLDYAGVATIPHNEIPWGRVQSLFINAAVFQDTGVMKGPRVSYKCVEKPALPITYSLQLYGWEELTVHVALATGSGRCLHPYVAPVNGTHTGGKHGAVGQLLESQTISSSSGAAGSGDDCEPESSNSIQFNSIQFIFV